MVARATQCLEDSGMTAKIKRACQEIHHYLQTRGQNQRKHLSEYIHPKPLPWGWQSGWIQGGQTAQVLQSRWKDQ